MIEEPIEATEAQAAERQALALHFREQWRDRPEDIPACAAGLDLLQAFAEANPAPYQLAVKQGFTDLTHPMFAKLPKWLAYVQHRTTCENCNEV